MDLISDAQGIMTSKSNIAKGAINKLVLQKLENDLDIQEKISILFLMSKDYTVAFDEIFPLYKKSLKADFNILVEFIDKHPENWECTLLEALCTIKNREVVRKLGLCYDELVILYGVRTRLCTKNFYPTIKCLYAMCEELTETEIKHLLELAKSDLPQYAQELSTIDILELHILYWMKISYISVGSGAVNLKNLLKHLKQFLNLDLIYTDLKKCEDRQNVLDANNLSSLNTCIPQNFSSSVDKRIALNSKTTTLRKIKKGLCIIISEVFFSGKKYETRFGTTSDCEKLIEAFKGFDFYVPDIFENLTKEELLNLLESIPIQYGTSYDCIFVCILSHGCRGVIITSDEEEVSIEAIEHAICCTALTDVIKIVIVQACQGKLTGQMSAETTDGPNDSSVANIASYRNFCLFMSTIQGFVSVRHKVQGSWFIQELCNVLQSGDSELTFFQLVSKVLQSVEQKRGKLDSTDAVAQLPELRTCRLLTDFQFPQYRPKRTDNLN